MNTDRINKILGIIIPVITSIVFIGGSKYLSLVLEAGESFNGVFVFSSFFIIPLLMGIISAYFWRNLSMKNSRYTLFSILTMLISVLFTSLFLGEGVICLLIVSPVLFGLIIAGAFIGKVMFSRKSDTLNVSVFGVLVLIMIVDIFSKHEYINKVTDTIVVNAPVEKVWPLVVEYEPITNKENYWLFQLGMPSPIQSTVDRHEVGANRKCIFSNGYIFDEKITVFKPNEELTFDILSQPRDPEIMGHIDIIRGQFILKDNGNGTTTIIGNSWYKLYIFPAWYFDFWAESITRNVHLRVMEHIKTLSEKNV